jgi:hypothetical protein
LCNAVKLRKKTPGGSVRKFVKPKAYYDIERRALKQIDKEKPTPAPKHKSQRQDLDDAYGNYRFTVF